MLRRIGRKDPKLYLTLFPDGIDTFIDLFMGTGAISFAMAQRCRMVIANDQDDEIFNLYHVIQHRKADLIQALTFTPVSEGLLRHWKANPEPDAIQKAVRFIFLSNFTLHGKGDTLSFVVPQFSKDLALTQLQYFFFGQHIKFMCCDFREVLPKISFITTDFGKPATHRERAFVYADPPYLDRTYAYAGRPFSPQDSEDLFTLLVDSGLRFAISEMAHPFILHLAQRFHLSVIAAETRRMMTSPVKETEILITNYEVEPPQLSMEF